MLIQAKIIPNSKKASIRIKDNVLIINLKSPAEKGKANQELVKHLTLKFGSCKIIKGKNSRKKVLDIPIDLNTLKNKVL